jgi:hypothetical protein
VGWATLTKVGRGIFVFVFVFFLNTDIHKPRPLFRLNQSIELHRACVDDGMMSVGFGVVIVTKVMLFDYLFILLYPIIILSKFPIFSFCSLFFRHYDSF